MKMKTVKAKRWRGCPRRTLYLFAALLPLVAHAQAPFPEGRGRDIAFGNCAQCHAIGKLVSAELSEEEWEFLVYDMIARGSTVHPDEIEVLKEYLQDNFARSDADE